MDDRTCVEFLQWALPHLHMRWEGFRKVRHQVCKRIMRRLQVQQLQDINSYQDYLQRRREEWAVLDSICRVTISRFFRDRLVFSRLQGIMLPDLVQQLRLRGEKVLRVWSAGCAAGEEPYSVNILWEIEVKPHVGDTDMMIEIIATDSDQQMLDRAAEGCYAYSSIKNLPENWRHHIFFENDGKFCLNPSFKRGAHFMCQDVRAEAPPGVFDLILCRNLVFTYFEDHLQRQVLSRMEQVLRPTGWLVIGIHELLPQDYDGFKAWSQRLGIYQRQPR